MDPQKYGYIDFDQLMRFMKKFNGEINQNEINALLRRLNADENFKIDFREFCHNLAPIAPGYTS